MWLKRTQTLPLRILVLRYRFIGDTLLSVPFFRNLRRAYPTAQIDALLAPDSAELLRDCPYIDTIHLLHKNRFLKTVALLRKQHYDKAYVLKRSLSSAILAFMTGIPSRIGFSGQGCDPGRPLLLTQTLPYETGPPRHERDSFLAVLQAEGHPVDERHLEAWWGEEETLRADHRFAPYTEYFNLGLNITSSNPLKQWPLEDPQRWAMVLQRLAAKAESQGRLLRLHCLGAPLDSLAVEGLRHQLPEGLRAVLVNHCGQTTLLEGIAFLSHLKGMLGVDSGLLHMAAAVGLPVVGLYGPMDEQQWGPITSARSACVTVDLPCRPCNLKTPCGHAYRCLTDMTAEQVLAACETVFTHPATSG